VRISYGKLRVPVHRIAGDDVFACEVSVEVLGENFAPAYTEGDNSNVVATDTMKNFILREAAAYSGATLEGFLAHIGDRMIATYPVMEALRVSGRELRFDRIAGKVFSRSNDDYGVASVEPGAVRGGRHGMMLLSTWCTRWAPVYWPTTRRSPSSPSRPRTTPATRSERPAAARSTPTRSRPRA
jgi:urate oxidase